mgnify:CR=1 FL=1
MEEDKLDDKELDGINSLVTMIKGLFRKDRLLEVVKDFIYFPDNSDKDLKIVCRYPRYFVGQINCMRISRHIFALKEMVKVVHTSEQQGAARVIQCFSLPVC